MVHNCNPLLLFLSESSESFKGNIWPQLLTRTANSSQSTWYFTFQLNMNSHFPSSLFSSEVPTRKHNGHPKMLPLPPPPPKHQAHLEITEGSWANDFRKNMHWASFTPGLENSKLGRGFCCLQLWSFSGQLTTWTSSRQIYLLEQTCNIQVGRVRTGYKTIWQNTGIKGKHLTPTFMSLRSLL